jgi:hypothetical protein
MPTAIQFDVKAECDPPVAGTLLQLHGLACCVFEGADSPVDHDAPLKLFAVGPLALRPGGTVEWTTAWLSDDTTPPVLGRPIRAHLGGTPVTLTPSAVRHRSFGALAQETATQAELVFLSPTVFSRSGTDALLPDPHLVFGSLARRWEVLAPPELRPPAELARELGHSTAVTSVDICTVRTDRCGGVWVRDWSPFDGTYRTTHVKGSQPRATTKARTGFVGTVTYELREPMLANWFGALLSFATFAGIGRATTHGCGTVLARLAHDGRGTGRTSSFSVPRRARPSGTQRMSRSGRTRALSEE